jgi:hypothetical protein
MRYVSLDAGTDPSAAEFAELASVRSGDTEALTIGWNGSGAK